MSSLEKLLALQEKDMAETVKQEVQDEDKKDPTGVNRTPTVPPKSSRA